jgi:hypothetical protein
LITSFSTIIHSGVTVGTATPSSKPNAVEPVAPVRLPSLFVNPPSPPRYGRISRTILDRSVACGNFGLSHFEIRAVPSAAAFPANFRR